MRDQSCVDVLQHAHCHANQRWKGPEEVSRTAVRNNLTVLPGHTERASCEQIWS